MTREINTQSAKCKIRFTIKEQKYFPRFTRAFFVISDMKTIILFSGGKDSFYSLAKVLEMGSVEYVVSVQSRTGDTQLHAGPEADEQVRKAQLDLLGLPHKQITVSSEKHYLHELFVELNKLVQEDDMTHLVTGDLWHPYTSGIGDMLAGALGVTLIRPARDACPTRGGDEQYMREITSSGIKSVIVSVRQGDLPKSFVGRNIDETLIQELVSMKVDAAAEGGEYQSLVLSAPQMKARIVIDDFSVFLVDGKNGKEKFYRMSINKFHVAI